MPKHDLTNIYRCAKVMKTVGMSRYASFLIRGATGWDLELCDSVVRRL